MFNAGFAEAAPTLPEPSEPTATEPAEPMPTAEPMPEPTPEPAPEPTPEPTPAVSASASGSTSTATDPIDRSADANDGDLDADHSPVQRAKDGMWGMQFTFGGLAPLSVGGINDYGVNRLLFTELGFRRVFKRIIVPFSIGAGVFHHNPDGDGGTQNDAGLAATVGVLFPFRVWRRISPYAGGQFHLHYLDPTGDNNWLVNVALGPVLGIEFYIAHRVSLLFQGQAMVGINIFDGLTQVAAGTSLMAGGQTGLIFYF